MVETLDVDRADAIRVFNLSKLEASFICSLMVLGFRPPLLCCFLNLYRIGSSTDRQVRMLDTKPS